MLENASSAREACGSAMASRVGISRRTLVKNAAWSVPVIAAAAAAPQAAASVTPLCSVDFDPLSVVYQRTSATSATLMWPDPFQTGIPVIMTIHAKQIGSTSVAAINPTENLEYMTDALYGGWNRGGIRLALDMPDGSRVSTGSGQDVTFALTYNGSPLAMSNFRFRVADIDGSYTSAGGSRELVWSNVGDGTRIVAGYLAGDGTSSNPFRRANPSDPSAANSMPEDTFATAGFPSAVPVSTYVVSFRANPSGAADNTTQRVWVTPPRFQAVRPGC